MKCKEIQELRQKPELELEKMLRENQERLRTLKFDLEAGKVKNVQELKSTRKLIAQILTFLQEKRNGST